MTPGIMQVFPRPTDVLSKENRTISIIDMYHNYYFGEDVWCGGDGGIGCGYDGDGGISGK